LNKEKNDVMHGEKYKSCNFIGHSPISLCLFADAAPLYASSKTSLSVMFSSIIELPQKVREAKENILVHSIIVGNRIDFNKWYTSVTTLLPDLFNQSVIVKNFKPKLFTAIFDLPARAKALNMINHAGYNACINCEVKGEYGFNKIYYPFVKNLPYRDKNKYRLCLDQVSENGSFSRINQKSEINIKGIKGPTVLSEHLDILQDVVYDYMHLCCEGYIKRFLKLIFNPPVKKNTINISTEYCIGKYICYLINENNRYLYFRQKFKILKYRIQENKSST
jgi:hypothetical protein